ncbi:MAG: ATP synthase F1 subunit delta [Planctomycetes bacterium]|nr:ATP synthase F1 subunit delta [Planctomycetota bacterium]
MILDPVTLRYAEALWALAERTGRLERVRGDVARLGSALPQGALEPGIEREKRRDLVLAALGSADEYVTNLVRMLFERRREEVLRGLAAAFHRLELASRNTVEGRVESARALGADVLASLAQSIGSVLGKQVVLENRVLPELLGGTRVIVANRMIDYSVAGRLEGLRRAMLEAPVGASR